MSLAAGFHQRCAPGKHLYAMFMRADVESLLRYLEVFEACNVRLYQSHGFTIRSEEVEPNSGIRGWGFLRA
jgi:hypothetical protein